MGAGGERGEEEEEEEFTLEGSQPLQSHPRGIRNLCMFSKSIFSLDVPPYIVKGCQTRSTQCKSTPLPKPRASYMEGREWNVCSACV